MAVFIKIRKLFFLCLIVFLSINGWAQYVNREQAMKMATDFIQEKTGLRSATELQLVHECEESSGLRAGGNSLYYIFNRIGREGFVIVSGDQRRGNILAYSFESSFTTDVPPNVQYMLDLYRDQIVAIRNNPAFAAVYAEDADADKDYGMELAPKVEPLITTKWGQYSPYFESCPIEITEGYTAYSVTGCVATAIAQVMNYHEWPVKGNGMVNYKTRTKGWDVALDLSTITFDWENMRDEYQPNKYTSEEADAVASLMYAVGAACYTDFSPDGSGAEETPSALAVIKHFGYNENMQLLRRSYINDEKWKLILKQQLSNNMPLVFFAYSKQWNGHAFVCDGYDERGSFFHFNWGWNGSLNGYYNIDEMDPQQTGGYRSYNHEQFILVNMCKPDVTVEKSYLLALDEEKPLWTEALPTFEEQGVIYTDVESEINVNETFTVAHKLFNAGLSNFDGVLALELRSEEYEETLVEKEIAIEARKDMEEQCWEVSLADIADMIQEGDYRLSIKYCAGDMGTDEWSEAPAPKGCRNYLPFTYKNGKLYFGTSTANERVETTSTSILLTNDVLTVKGEGIRNVMIYSPTGQLVHHATYDKEAEVQFSMSNYVNGIYYIVVTTPQGNTVQRILKR